MENITHLAINKHQNIIFYLELCLYFPIIYLFINKHSDWYGLKHPKGDISFLDSCYFTLITFSTIGYGDITPI